MAAAEQWWKKDETVYGDWQGKKRWLNLNAQILHRYFSHVFWELTTDEGLKYYYNTQTQETTCTSFPPNIFFSRYYLHDNNVINISFIFNWGEKPAEMMSDSERAAKSNWYFDLESFFFKDKKWLWLVLLGEGLVSNRGYGFSSRSKSRQ